MQLIDDWFDKFALLLIHSYIRLFTIAYYESLKMLHISVRMLHITAIINQIFPFTIKNVLVEKLLGPPTGWKTIFSQKIFNHDKKRPNTDEKVEDCFFQCVFLGLAELNIKLEKYKKMKYHLMFLLVIRTKLQRKELKFKKKT